MRDAHHLDHPRTSHDAAQQLPLDVARECFAWLITGPQPLSMDGRAFPGLPNRKIPLDELRDRLLRRRVSRRTRDAVWAQLVRRSRAEGATWTLACTGMALPALAGLAGWLQPRFPGEAFDVQAELLTGFLGALAVIDLRRPQVLARLKWAAYRTGCAALYEALDAPVPIGGSFRSTPPRPPWGHPDLVLAQAVRAKILTRIEADVIGATRLERVPLATWTAEHHLTPGAAYKLRRRAEHRLVAYLRDQARDTGPDDPVAAHAMVGLPSAAPPPRAHRSLPHPASTSSSVTRSAASSGKKSPIGVSKTAAESGLLGCGATTPAATPTPSSEVRRCA